MALAEFEAALQSYALRRDPDPALLPVLGGDPGRWHLYRSMVRTRFRRTLREALPHLLKATGDDGFDEWIARFLDAERPHARFFRDVPVEFAAYVAASPQASVDAVDAALLDQVVIEVRDDPAPDELGEPRFDFEAPARLIAASRVVRSPRGAWVAWRRQVEQSVRYRRVPAWFADWIDRFCASGTPGGELRAMLASGAFEATLLQELSEVLAELVGDGAIVSA